MSGNTNNTKKGKRIRRIRIPATDKQSARFDHIKRLVKEGKSLAQIALEMDLSKARVGQIVANMRRRGMMVKSKAKVGRPKNPEPTES